MISCSIRSPVDRGGATRSKAVLARLLALLFFGVFWGCAAHTNLEPLPVGRLSPHASVGGPVVAAFGTRVPLPYLTAGADYGFAPRLVLSGNVHLLPLAYGVAGADGAVAWFTRKGTGAFPTVGVEARAAAFVSLRGRVGRRMIGYPVFSVSSAWDLPSGLLYTGAHLAGPLPEPEYDPAAARFLVSPFVGYRWALGRRYALLTELKWHGVNLRTDQLAVSYLHPFGRGALAPMVALSRRF